MPRFDTVKEVPTDGHPGVFATLDAGAPRTVDIYFMYDVKQVDFLYELATVSMS
ncbi:MAG: hypothetical protein ACJ746_19855 [Bryobacteraceae bacterium]